jgi:hypothetical protein
MYFFLQISVDKIDFFYRIKTIHLTLPQLKPVDNLEETTHIANTQK